MEVVQTSTDKPDIKEEKKERKRTWLQLFLEDNAEKLLRYIFFWEEDPKRIGGFIRFLHHSVVYMLILWYITIHTFLPSLLLFVLFYVIVSLIWIHHLICGGCIISRIEQRLIGDTDSLVDAILDLFHIPITPESTDGFVIFTSTIIMIMLSFELIIRCITLIKNSFSI